jgi:hypothetical protein
MAAAASAAGIGIGFVKGGDYSTTTVLGLRNIAETSVHWGAFCT